MNIKIENKVIGSDKPCFIIAEVAQAHDGSLGAAHAYIDAVAKTGVDAIKFQTHIASAESSAGEKFRVNFSYQDKSRYEYWKRMEFSREQWKGLADHARDVGLIFLSSPFSEEAVDLLDEIGCPAWKVGSGEVNSYPLLLHMAKTKKPILLSSGMASWYELDQALAFIKVANSKAGLFQCTSSYPCIPEKWGLNVIDEMRQRYPLPIGYSDHSGNIFAGLAAVVKGIDMLEVHVTFSRHCFGPDVTSSITIEELGQLVKGVRQIELSLSHPLNKDLYAMETQDLKRVFGKSIFSSRNIPSGKVIELEDLAFRKPGNGIPAADFRAVIGMKATKQLDANTLLDFNQLVRMDDPIK